MIKFPTSPRARLRLFTLLILLFPIPYSLFPVFAQTQKFNNSWEFRLDNSDWCPVSLPHDWSIEHEASPSLASCTGYLPGGVGEYRKFFTLDSLPKPLNSPNPTHYSLLTTHYYIYFEGVYNRSEVYLNGHLLGARPNGYVSFEYELTPYLKEGVNELLVKVDHSRSADSRWYTGSGIYRDVWIKAKNATHFALYSNSEIVGDTVGTRIVRNQIINPKPWSLDEPNLYPLRSELWRGDELLDVDERMVGFRTIEFDPNQGLFLNGENIKIKGVCIHHDAGVLGSVVPDFVWERRLKELKALGCNAIRMSHNPQAPIVYALCDRLGLLVIDEGSDEWEFPKRKWLEGWNVGEPGYEGSFDFFEEWIGQDVADMVRRDLHNPSIFLWSVGNEVDYPNDPYSHPVLDGSSINQPMFGGYKPDAPNAERIGLIAEKLAKVIRAIDPSRPVTGALAGVVMSNQTIYPEVVDVVGYNYTEDRYQLDHELYPERIIYGSENGMSYDAWKAVRDNDFIFGQFLWTGLDYLGESRAWPSRGLGTGLLGFAALKKPRGWFRQALWSNKPTCYIGTQLLPPATSDLLPALSIDAWDNWDYQLGDIVRVMCYTNAPAAQLLLNDVLVGEPKLQDDQTGIIYWDIPFAPGTLKAQGLDAELLTANSEYIIKTPGEPVDIECEYLDEHHILCRIVDAQGNTVYNANNLITCSAPTGTLLALENSDNSDMQAHTRTVLNHSESGLVTATQRAFRGQIVAYITRGEVSFTLNP